MPTIELAQQLFKQANQRAPTGEVNRALTDAVRRRSPRPRRGRIAKFLYDPGLVTAPYRRYLANALRERLPFPEVPVRLHFRRRSRKAREGGAD